MDFGVVEEELLTLKKQWLDFYPALDLENKQKRIAVLKEILSGVTEFNQSAIIASKELSSLEKYTDTVSKIQTNLTDLPELLQIVSEMSESEKLDLVEIFHETKFDLDSIVIETSFSNKEDRMNCFLEINAGVGGSDSQDWVEILLRMYTLWTQKRKFKLTIEDEDKGEVAGYKSIRILVEGEFAYGLLKYENGTHRLVRISPFNANDKRQTSFAGVFVYPQIEDNNSVIKIDESEIKIEAMRSSGAGGQHVNRTESAIRITHVPSGIIVKSQSSRSQAQNKELAMKNLRSRLYQLKLEEDRKKMENLREDSGGDISWGTQVRNYVMHPYQLVKDLRSGYETGNIAKILNGDLDDLIKTLIFKKN